jgi:hypothetical protein
MRRITQRSLRRTSNCTSNCNNGGDPFNAKSPAKEMKSNKRPL